MLHVVECRSTYANIDTNISQHTHTLSLFPFLSLTHTLSHTHTHTQADLEPTHLRGVSEEHSEGNTPRHPILLGTRYSKQYRERPRIGKNI